MRIGVFDSGLGGLLVGHAIMQALPQYDYLYLGDTKRLPYGNRSQASIHEFVGQALDYLFREDCHLVVLACNTASAESLRRSQQEYLPRHFPERRVLGVVIPMAEAAIEACPDIDAPRIGVLATASTVESGAYVRELTRSNPLATVTQQPSPLLVPLVENDGIKYVGPILDDYLTPLVRSKMDALVLGCTHYAALKSLVRDRVRVPVLSPDEVVPAKFADYLERHPEHRSRLSTGGTRKYVVTDLTESYASFAKRLTGEQLELEVVDLIQ